MAISNKERAKLHRWLDELLDAASNISGGSSVLLLRETEIQHPEFGTQPEVHIRAVIGKGSTHVRQIVHQLRKNDDS